jgi:hypothetical protein
MPSGRKDQPSVGFRKIEHRLCGAGGIVSDSPGNEDCQDAIATLYSTLDYSAVIGVTGNYSHAVFELVELGDALLTANAHYLVPFVERVTDHISAEFS